MIRIITTVRLIYKLRLNFLVNCSSIRKAFRLLLNAVSMIATSGPQIPALYICNISQLCALFRRGHLKTCSIVSKDAPQEHSGESTSPFSNKWAARDTWKERILEIRTITDLDRLSILTNQSLRFFCLTLLKYLKPLL